MECYCEHGNGPLGSMKKKVENLIGLLSKRDPAPRTNRNIIVISAVVLEVTIVLCTEDVCLLSCCAV